MDGRSPSCPSVGRASRREAIPADLAVHGHLRPLSRADVLVAAIRAFASNPRAILDYVRLIASTFGNDLRLVARNLVVIPKACFYASVVRRSGYRHIHAHWATVSTSAAMLIVALVRRAVFLHRPRLGHFLRHPAPGREGRCRPVRADLHRLQPAAPRADGEDRPQQGPRALPRTAHSQSIGGARRLGSGVPSSS